MRGKGHRQRDPPKSATLTEHPILTEPGPHTGPRLIYLHGECRFSEDSVEFGYGHANSKVLLRIHVKISSRPGSLWGRISDYTLQFGRYLHKDDNYLSHFGG